MIYLEAFSMTSKRFGLWSCFPLHRHGENNPVDDDQAAVCSLSASFQK